MQLRRMANYDKPKMQMDEGVCTAQSGKHLYDVIQSSCILMYNSGGDW